MRRGGPLLGHHLPGRPRVGRRHARPGREARHGRGPERGEEAAQQLGARRVGVDGRRRHGPYQGVPAVPPDPDAARRGGPQEPVDPPTDRVECLALADPVGAERGGEDVRVLLGGLPESLVARQQPEGEHRDVGRGHDPHRAPRTPHLHEGGVLPRVGRRAGDPRVQRQHGRAGRAVLQPAPGRPAARGRRQPTVEVLRGQAGGDHLGAGAQVTVFPVVSARALLGCTRFGSPGILGYSGG